MLYKILKDFRGSQDGRFAEDFKAGTEAELSDYLAGCIDKSWAEPVTAAPTPEPPVVENKAVETDGKQPKRTKK